MERDQSSEDSSPPQEHATCKSFAEVGNITRRELLIGSASTVVAGQVLAAEQTTPYLDVYYEDATRHGLVFAWVDPPVPPALKAPRYEWRLRSSTFTDDDVLTGRFILRKTPKGWHATLPRCSFPGGYQFDLAIEAIWNAEKPKLASLTFNILSRELRVMGYRKLSARPRHHAQDAAAVAAFKKTSLPSWRLSPRRQAASL